jgi:hypothetical protein
MGIFDPITGTKRCSNPQCSETDPNRFNKNKSQKDGLQAYCRTCSRRHGRESMRRYYKERDAKRGISRNPATQQRREFRQGLGVELEKSCYGCPETDISMFNKNRSRQDGLQAYCKACQRAGRPTKPTRGPQKSILRDFPRSLLGQRFGKWEVIGDTTKNGRRFYCLSRCECGTERLVRHVELTGGRTNSCGCIHRGRGRGPDKSKRTLQAQSLIHKPTYTTWSCMNTRCYCVSHRGYKNYGGKGIVVCPEWRGQGGFGRFFAYMGPRPEGHTIHRFNNARNYEPGNVKWATKEEQNAPGNRRTKRQPLPLAA